MYDWAAGNSQTNACTTTPANVDVVLAVGATEARNKFSPGMQQQDVLYTWGNTGPCIDLFAPGKDVVAFSMSCTVQL